ncbi:hypothetical protein KVR01_008846 [Diaporthe batatas]|uniref:uncharacterized protein n=1 Tax=Diaporthe batatas TaxID=748121 RepID=UPI001D045023|nr:uncharacterized protein KVR01_008846 [Diaporthe batatas]KAG8161859.1 hypothetical protein KVR01_008846 [Diaporthe batatas]
MLQRVQGTRGKKNSGRRDHLLQIPQPPSPGNDNKHKTSIRSMTLMAATSDLYGALHNSRLWDGLSGRRYIPNSALREILPRDNVIAELNKHRKRRLLPLPRQSESSKKLADSILGRGRKLFAILIMLNLSWEIKDLLDAGLTDEDLPLLKSGNCLTSSAKKTKTFEWPVNWGPEKADYFVDTAQWLLLAPVFCTRGAHKDLAQECPLPFVKVKEISGGQISVVYKVSIDPSHQKGFEIEAPSLEVALKEFRYPNDFKTERENLNAIRGSCSSNHITQSLETFSQGNKRYIIFPWAEGGDLDNFWKEKNREHRSPQLADWCLRQMLGLAEALDFLHNQIGNQANFRHGDLKPGNILHFPAKEDPYGVLKIADFGISRVHNVATLQRKGVETTTRATTPSYEAPEALSRGIPRSRKYDIWSLGCIYLEFTIWFMRDWRAVENFSLARKSTAVGDDELALFYYKKDSTAEDSIEVHPAVADNITSLRQVAEGAEGTTFGDLLDTIEFKLLRVKVEDRIDAKKLCELLSAVLQRAHGDQG